VSVCVWLVMGLCVVMAQRFGTTRRVQAEMAEAARMLRDAAGNCERGDFDDDLPANATNTGVAIGKMPEDNPGVLAYIARLPIEAVRAVTVAAVLDEVSVLAIAANPKEKGRMARIGSLMAIGMDRLLAELKQRPSAKHGRGRSGSENGLQEQPRWLHSAMDAMREIDRRLVRVGDECGLASVCAVKCYPLVRDLVEHDGRFRVDKRRMGRRWAFYVVRVAVLPVARGAGEDGGRGRPPHQDEDGGRGRPPHQDEDGGRGCPPHQDAGPTGAPTAGKGGGA